MTSRKMLYPYTLGAKLANFPYRLYYEQCVPFKYFLMAVVLSCPLFYKIQKLSYAPGNVKKYEEYQKKRHHEHLEHLEHLL